MGEHPYRPLPPPPRMRWAVVQDYDARWPWRLLAGALGASVACLPLAYCGWGFAARMVPTWLGASVGLWLSGLRLVRVPVEPPRVRVPTEYTMEEHRDLTDAGYVYDHEARVYRLRDEWDLDTQRRIDALMRAGLVEVETVEMPSARKEARRG